AVTGGAVMGQANLSLGVGGNMGSVGGNGLGTNFFDGTITVNSGQLLQAGRGSLGFAGRNSQQTLTVNTSAAMTGATVATSTPSISTATATATTATIVTSTPHGFVTGESVTIASVANAAYNGTFTITVVDPSTFTYALATAPGASTGGTATGTLTTVTTGSAH